MRITVYAIAKDEAKHVRRWMESMREADDVVVLDTGSTDGTPELLRKEGALVREARILPWRFDVARNRSMELVPDGTDLCVCTDLDEVFTPGWRSKAEEAWTEALAKGMRPTTLALDFACDLAGGFGYRYTYKRAHAPGVCRWTHPVHEYLSYSVPTCDVYVPGVRLEHHADPSKSRDQYLSLLEMAVDEDPNDDRNVHYYGRELFYRGRYRDAIIQLTRHLAMPRATWAPERAASMRFVAQCLLAQGEYGMAVEWWRRAIDEAPGFRDAAMELENAAYDRRDWNVVVEAGEKAVRVQRKDASYTIRADSWTERPWDLLALGYHYSGLPVQAEAAERVALALAPERERGRLESNLAFMRAAGLQVR